MQNLLMGIKATGHSPEQHALVHGTEQLPMNDTPRGGDLGDRFDMSREMPSCLES